MYDVISVVTDIKAAVRSSYGKSGDYMHDVARIHEIVRGW